MAVDVGRLVGSQPGGKGGHVLRLAAQPAHVAAAHTPGRPQVAGLVGDAANHPGLGAGGDGVGGDAVAAHIPSHHAGEAGNAVLGRPVIGLAGVAVQPGGRTEGDDPPGTLLPEEDAGVLDDGKGALEVHRYDVVPLLLAHVENHPVAEDAGAGYHCVQLAVVVYGGLDNLFAALHGRHRLLAGHGLAASLPDFDGNLFGDRLVEAAAVQVYTGVNDHDLGSLGGHLQGNALAHAAARAGYDCNFVLKKIGHLCAPRWVYLYG